MSNKLHIRTAEIKDLATIAEVHHKSAKLAYAALLSPKAINKIFGKEVLYQDWYKYLTESRTNPNLLPLVATDSNGAILGVARANIGNQTEEKVLSDIGHKPPYPIEKIAHLKNIYIDPDAQAQGVGKILTKHIARWAKQNGCLNMITMVLDHYEKSPAFFKKIAAAKKIGKCQSDVSAMYKNLPPKSVVLNFGVYNMISMDYIIHKAEKRKTSAHKLAAAKALRSQTYAY